MNRPHLLLLHGALGASGQFGPLRPYLADPFTLHALDFEGHGRAPFRRPFRLEHFVENVVEYLDQQGLERVNVFGYSMGGFVACVLAKERPERVERIATLGTKYHWDAEVAAREVALLDPQKIAAKVPRFAQVLAERHVAAGWEMVCRQTAGLLQLLGERGGFRPEEAAGLSRPVRVMIGDRDTTVTLEESRAIYQALPQGQLEVLPATPHPLEKASPTRLAYSLLEFFT